MSSIASSTRRRAASAKKQSFAARWSSLRLARRLTVSLCGSVCEAAPATGMFRKSSHKRLMVGSLSASGMVESALSVSARRSP
jgi:hypothetical protein